jgi:hypothetical protein
MNSRNRFFSSPAIRVSIFSSEVDSGKSIPAVNSPAKVTMSVKHNTKLRNCDTIPSSEKNLLASSPRASSDFGGGPRSAIISAR